MFRNLIAAFCYLGLGSQASAKSSSEPLRLKASSPWNVDYADDRCRLMRVFGGGDEKVFAIYDRYGPGEHFRTTIAGMPIKSATENGEASIQFGPGEGELRLPFYKGSLGKLPALVFHSQARVAPPTPVEQSAIDSRKNNEEIELAPVGPERESAIKYMTIGKPLRRPIVLETGSMHKPLEALGKCIYNLTASWGIDVEKHKSLMRKATPVGSSSSWVVTGDYPTEMLRSAQAAIIEFRLSVGADGVPTACHIQSTTRPKKFDQAVCQSVMRRARFEPALDAAGSPITSYHQNTVHFQIK